MYEPYYKLYKHWKICATNEKLLLRALSLVTHGLLLKYVQLHKQSKSKRNN